MVVLPVIRESLVESGILLRGDIVRVASPDGLRLVELFMLNLLLLNRLLLLVFLGFLIDLLNL